MHEPSSTAGAGSEMSGPDSSSGTMALASPTFLFAGFDVHELNVIRCSEQHDYSPANCSYPATFPASEEYVSALWNINGERHLYVLAAG